jgi:hypothetical protein
MKYASNVALRHVHATSFCGKAINITYSECVFVALGIQHAMGMHHTLICGLPGSTYFPTLCHKRHGLKNTVIERKMCV